MTIKPQNSSKGAFFKIFGFSFCFSFNKMKGFNVNTLMHNVQVWPSTLYKTFAASLAASVSHHFGALRTKGLTKENRFVLCRVSVLLLRISVLKADFLTLCLAFDPSFKFVQSLVLGKRCKKLTNTLENIIQ